MSDANLDQQELEAAILKYVGRPSYQPVKPKVLAKKLGLEERAMDVRRAVKKLVKRGQLAYGSKHVVRVPQQGEIDAIVGVYQRTSEGYGFVRPRGTGLTGVREKDREADIYIAAENSRDAVTGDLVVVKLRSTSYRGRSEGYITEILERQTNRFVGTYFEREGQGRVRVDGNLFSRSVYVGDPGAKNAREGDKVVFEMVRFPSYMHDGEGVIVEVLGPRGAPGVDTLSIIREYNLPGDFDEDALQEAREQSKRFNEEIEEGRHDLTGETIITIDPVDARDFDDAISLTRLENGHWLLGVHIADVAHFVRPNTALDREARDRATSCYLPDRVIPMLPELISNSLASLQPGKLRYAKTVQMEFTADGARVATDLMRTAIRSARRFTYEEVDDYIAHPEKWKRTLSPEVFELLGRMRELAAILRNRRMLRGSLELDMPEIKVDLDDEGRVSGAHVEINTESHKIIEDFMLAANEAVAERLHDRGWQFLRRIHETPSPRKLKALTEFVNELGIRAPSLQNRFALQSLLREVADMPERYAVNYAVLRSLPQAVYSPVEEGHYALAAEFYCHFTSPIRRYPDLTIHRLVDALIDGTKPENQAGELVVLGEHCSQRERRAEAAERELTKVKLLSYLENRIGEEFDGVITGVTDYGFFVRGTEIPVEGLVHIASLLDDYYHFERRSHLLEGRREGNQYRLGDMVRVRVARVDIERREVDLHLVARLKRDGTAAKTPGGRKAAKPQGRTNSKPARGGTAKRGKTPAKGKGGGKKKGRKRG